MRITAIVFLAVLLSLSLDFILVGAGLDSEPPMLLSFSYHPIEVVDESDGRENVMIIAHIVDDSSGLYNGSQGGHQSHIQFFSPSWKESLVINLTPTDEGNLTSGNARDGVYVAEIDVSNLTAGNWTLDHIYLMDNQGNSDTISDNDLEMLGIPGAFIVDWGFPSVHAALITIPAGAFMLLFMMMTLRSTGFKSPCRGPCGYVRAIPGHLKRIYAGHDGLASTSKAQFFLWTTVAIFGYLVVFSDRILMHCEFKPPSEVPYHLFMAMGLSVITATAAKAITMRDPSKDSTDSDEGVVGGGLFTDDNGSPDLSKIQMMAWTAVAVVVFSVGVLHNVWWDTKPPEIPDIDESLLALMGIGQGAYITKKIVSRGGGSMDEQNNQTETETE